MIGLVKDKKSKTCFCFLFSKFACKLRDFWRFWRFFSGFPPASKTGFLKSMTGLFCLFKTQFIYLFILSYVKTALYWKEGRWMESSCNKILYLHLFWMQMKIIMIFFSSWILFEVCSYKHSIKNVSPHCYIFIQSEYTWWVLKKTASLH